MSNSNHRPRSASGVKNDLRSTNGDSFLPDSDEGNESGNTTNTSDEVYDDFHFTNDKLRSRGIDWKAFEDSLDCDGELMGWRCVGLPVKLKRSETKYGQMEPLGLLQPIVMTEKEENQQQKAWLVLMETKHRKELKKSHAEITALREENVQLRTALLKAQAEFSHIQAQLDMLKQEFIDQDDGDLQAERTQFPLYKSLMDRGSPGGLTSHLESGPSSCLSPEKISSRRCDKIPGSYMPSKRRILFLHSDLSDSDQVLDPISCDISESDREAAHELDRDTATIVDPVKSRCSGSDMLCQRKPQLPNQVVSSCEDERSEPTYRLVLAGDMGSGKSSFVLRLSQHQFRENMRSTVGVDCQIKRMLVDGKKMALQIWDTAGQERFHSISRSYFRKASGILLLYDITSEKSFLNITQWLEQIEACTTTSVPLCLVGNKADLRGKVSNSHCVSSACGMRLATTCGALFFETSAKDGTNVVEAVLHLAREVKKAGCVPTCSTLQLSSLSDGESSAANCCWVIA